MVKPIIVLSLILSHFLMFLVGVATLVPKPLDPDEKEVLRDIQKMNPGWVVQVFKNEYGEVSTITTEEEMP